MENKHSNSIPPEEVEILNQKVREINEIISRYANPLTPKERRELSTMGDKTIGFVEKSYEYAKANPDLCPSFLNISDFEIDMADATGLRVLRNNINQAFEVVDDIVLLSGSEAYHAALTFYHYLKFTASEDITRAKTIYAELKNRFPGRSKSKKENNTEDNSK